MPMLLIPMEAVVSYTFYKVLHLVSILFLFTSIGTLLATAGAEAPRLRRLAGVAHGVSLVLILTAGFGLLARLGLVGGFPLWVWLKMGVWLALGLVVLPLRSRPGLAPVAWPLLPALGGVAAWLAVAKP